MTEEEIFEDPEEESQEVEEPKKTPKKKKTSDERGTLVVSQLPQQSMSSAVIEGKEYNLITVEDALTEILEKVRRIDKAL